MQLRANVERAPLLTTKLTIPQVHSVVSRAGLLERMDEATRVPLALLSAPAGFGKTTLLAEWAGRASVSVGWLSLDDADNDPLRFFTYLGAAARGQPEAGPSDGLAEPEGTDSASVNAWLSWLINDLAARSAGLALVLDDYHTIAAPSIHAGVAFLLEHMPATMHLVIATRADPPLPLSRLRARAQLLEVRAAELRFSNAEAGTFLSRMTGLQLPEASVAALTERTEGWIAGLQMAAVSLRDREDADAFISGFAGSNRYVMDYLVEEVLQRQPPEMERFLLDTCVLDRLCGPLADALTGGGDGRRMLQTIEDANLFVSPLDQERRWYRYHQLLADLLRARLREEDEGRCRELHRRASEWFEREGDLEAAVGHALEAVDTERAASLVEAAAEGCLASGALATLRRWLDALPEQAICSRPYLCAVHAMVLLTGEGSVALVEARLERAQELEGSAPAGRGRRGRRRRAAGELAAVRATVAVYRGDVEAAGTECERALSLLPVSGGFFRTVVLRLQAYCSYLSTGDARGTLEALEDVERLGRRSGNLGAVIAALCEQAELSIVQGKLARAEGLYQRALEAAQGATEGGSPMVGLAMIGLGELRRERNDIEGALEGYAQGLKMLEAVGPAALDGHG